MSGGLHQTAGMEVLEPGALLVATISENFTVSSLSLATTGRIVSAYSPAA